MRNYYTLFLLFLLSFAFISCDRDYPEIEFQLPEETQTGANTIGFMLGNVVWTNYGKDCTLYGCERNPAASYTPPNSYNSLKYLFSLSSVKRIRENRQDRLFQNFGLSINTLDSLKTYKFGGENNEGGVLFNDWVVGKSYGLHPERAPFTVTITRLDSIERIFSGRFEGVLFNERDLADSIIIRNGRFDVK